MTGVEHQERRKDTVSAGIVARLNVLETGHEELKAQISANTLLTQQVKNDTAALVSFFKDAEGFVKTITFLGKWSRNLLIAGGSIGAFWYAITHGGKWPP